MFRAGSVSVSLWAIWFLLDEEGAGTKRVQCRARLAAVGEAVSRLAWQQDNGVALAHELNRWMAIHSPAAAQVSDPVRLGDAETSTVFFTFGSEMFAAGQAY